MHNNGNLEVLFEPSMEPGIDLQLWAELKDADIKAVFLVVTKRGGAGCMAEVVCEGC